MPTTPSDFEAAEMAAETNAADQARMNRTITGCREEVNRVQRHDSKHREQFELVARHDNDPAFRVRVRRERRLRFATWVFLGAIFGAAIGEFFASGDVAEWLGNQIAPHFHLPPGEATPAWLCRLAGMGFVTILVGTTLLTKYVITHFQGYWSEERAVLQPGQGRRHRQTTLGLAATHAAKVAYLACIAWLYVWLYGFSISRGVIVERMTAEAAASQQVGTISVDLTDGEAAVLADSAQLPASVVDTIGGSLSRATGVVYICLFLFHVCILLCPTATFDEPLEYASFRRGRANRIAQTEKTQRDELCRELYQRTTDATEFQPQLIREILPIADLINAAVGRIVVAPSTEPGATTPTPDTALAATPALSPAAAPVPAPAPAVSVSEASPDPAPAAVGPVPTHLPLANMPLPGPLDPYDAIFG